MKYVACYCRVSHEEQVKYGYSINAQKDALIKYCKENGYKYELYVDFYDEYIRRFTDIDINAKEMYALIDACVFDIWFEFNDKNNCILRIYINTDKEYLSFVQEDKLNKALAIIKKYNIKEQALGFYCKYIDTVGNFPIYDIDILYNNIYE